MTGKRFLEAASIALLAAGMSLGVAACGSDDADSGEPDAPKASGSTSGGEMTPEKKAPESAKDKKNAPDDVVSDKPGGSSKPANP